jgi:hypothetical protein
VEKGNIGERGVGVEREGGGRGEKQGEEKRRRKSSLQLFTNRRGEDGVGRGEWEEGDGKRWEKGMAGKRKGQGRKW